MSIPQIPDRHDMLGGLLEAGLQLRDITGTSIALILVPRSEAVTTSAGAEGEGVPPEPRCIAA